jgi:hypothetical protein
MRVKLDENLPLAIAGALARLGHDVDTVASEGLTGSSDSDVWQASQDSQRFLITQDLDFSDIRRFTPGTHCGILLVRLWYPGRRALTRRVVGLFSSEDIEKWSGSFVVATDHKLRVRRPEETAP